MRKTVVRCVLCGDWILFCFGTYLHVDDLHEWFPAQSTFVLHGRWLRMFFCMVVVQTFLRRLRSFSYHFLVERFMAREPWMTHGFARSLQALSRVALCFVLSETDLYWLRLSPKTFMLSGIVVRSGATHLRSATWRRDYEQGKGPSRRQNWPVRDKIKKECAEWFLIRAPVMSLRCSSKAEIHFLKEALTC